MNKETAILKGKRKGPTSKERILDAAREEFIASGFEGARIQNMVRAAQTNPKVLYDHYRSKSELYVAVLEEALAALRKRETTLDVVTSDPREGLLSLFDFLCDHFRTHPELVRLLTNENIEKAQYIRTSTRIAEMSSPVLRQIEVLLARGQKAGTLRDGIDALTLYVMMAGLAQFHISNVHTLSTIFDTDIDNDAWRDRHNATAREMFATYLDPERS